MNLSEQWHGPTCKCGSTNTQRIGESSLMRFCHSCGRTHSYRVCDGHVVPLAIETAEALDSQRRGRG